MHLLIKCCLFPFVADPGIIAHGQLGNKLSAPAAPAGVLELLGNMTSM
jgi:hypothetical protein